MLRSLLKVRSFKAGCCPWHEAPLVHVPPPPPKKRVRSCFTPPPRPCSGCSGPWRPWRGAPRPPGRPSRTPQQHPCPSRCTCAAAVADRQPVSDNQTVSTSGEGHATQAGTVAMAKTSTGKFVKSEKPSQTSQGEPPGVIPTPARATRPLVNMLPSHA